ncbi:hypothetical protein CEXT_10771 [Caerostris extrusa]|uniref:Uncharacterized protein n=1 Tax=Caerostris extrusa TaxID=172846 RepID=A0AAV4NR01_CAEEX|nr:hypothetical protein CEXT_10771 [Caerostris extrusa]
MNTSRFIAHRSEGRTCPPLEGGQCPLVVPKGNGRRGQVWDHGYPLWTTSVGTNLGALTSASTNARQKRALGDLY